MKRTEEEFETIVQKRIDYLATFPIKPCSTMYDVSMMLLTLASQNVIIDHFMNEAVLTKIRTKAAMEFYFRAKKSYNYAVSKAGKKHQPEPSTCKHQFEAYCNRRIEALKNEKEQINRYRTSVMNKLNCAKDNLFSNTLKQLGSDDEGFIRFNSLCIPVARLVRSSSVDLLDAYNLQKKREIYRFIRLCKACGELIPEQSIEYVKSKYGEKSDWFVQLAEDYNKGLYEQVKEKLAEINLYPNDFEIIFTE